MSGRDVTIDALAAARLARIINKDRIGRPIRGALIRVSYRHGPPNVARLHSVPTERWPEVDPDEPPALADMVKCRWCLGMWCAVFVVVARRVAPRAWDPIALALVGSYTSGITGMVEDALHHYVET